jgi:hypothetical protein
MKKDFSPAGSQFGEVSVGLSIISARFRLRVTSEKMKGFEPGGIRTLDHFDGRTFFGIRPNQILMRFLCHLAVHHVSEPISELGSIYNVHLPADIRPPIL